jgi:tetratricopeptide (TPR) repeat protein
VPYIEKRNGTILVNRKEFEEAVKHYSKALFALKMLFENENNIIGDTETAVRFIREIEIPVCLNLCHCYLKIEQYHYVIKYASQVLDKDEEN